MAVFFKVLVTKIQDKATKQFGPDEMPKDEDSDAGSDDDPPAVRDGSDETMSGAGVGHPNAMGGSVV